ncbi:MAG: ribosomal RNA small subunit methyltransferase I, partial [Betaproteobacteria bacterium]|nr:ribosomal RNA small subunit methyltransferase I [Betaproteobacteria bacterium]
VACGLSLPQGWCRTLTVEQWRKSPPVFEKGLPAVFGFLA